MNSCEVCIEFDELLILPLQKALHLVHLVEERLRSSVSLWPLLPRQLLRNRELQLADGTISLFFQTYWGLSLFLYRDNAYKNLSHITRYTQHILSIYNDFVQSHML
jgi:hypothetical protein